MRGLSRLKTPPLLACLAISFFPGCGSKTGAKSKSEEIEVSAPKLAMGAEVDDIAGWNGVPWGTSRDQAKSILGTRYSKIKSVAGNEELAIEDFRIENFPYTCNLMFRGGDGLVRILVRPKSRANSVIEVEFNMLMDG